jgi:uncharacterized protein (TIGR03643 family)
MAGGALLQPTVSERERAGDAGVVSGVGMEQNLKCSVATSLLNPFVFLLFRDLITRCRTITFMPAPAALNPETTDRIIQMAWEDRTPFEAIEAQFGLKEKEVVELMRREMKRGSFEMWRKRMRGKTTKHRALRENATGRFKCARQRDISLNKIAKRGRK